MSAAAATAVLDSTAAKNVAKVAIAEGAYAGFVPPETMEFLYSHLPSLEAELVKPLLGFETPSITLSVDKESIRQLGHYKPYRDGLGLRWRISLNVLHLGKPKANVISVLLHEVLHAVQHKDGKPGRGNYHNAEFVAWCERLGIPTNSKGHCLGITEGGLFDQYAKRHKLDGKVGLVEQKVLPRAAGSKMKKWTCSCGVNIRAAVEIDVTCNECGESFVKQG